MIYMRLNVFRIWKICLKNVFRFFAIVDIKNIENYIHYESWSNKFVVQYRSDKGKRFHFVENYILCSKKKIPNFEK